MHFEYPEIGICGLSCRLCPMYNTETKSKCNGCKTESRIAVGCPFITCAVKKKQIEFCWNCTEHTSCSKWSKHRELGKKYDSFKCYQKLENNIFLFKKMGLPNLKSFRKLGNNCLKRCYMSLMKDVQRDTTVLRQQFLKLMNSKTS